MVVKHKHDAKSESRAAAASLGLKSDRLGDEEGELGRLVPRALGGPARSARRGRPQSVAPAVVPRRDFRPSH